MSSKLSSLLDDYTYSELIHGGIIEIPEDNNGGEYEQISISTLEKSPDIQEVILEIYEDIKKYFEENSLEIGTLCNYFEFQQWISEHLNIEFE